MRISELQNAVVEAIIPAATEVGLADAGGGRFRATSNGVSRLITVDFLDTRHAATFGTCTASFSVEAGVYFSCEREEEEIEPEALKHYECQIRQLLVRDIRQPPPSRDLSGPDSSRRDIWWVDRDGGNLVRAAESAARVVRKQAPRFFARFADPKRAYRFFALWRFTRWFSVVPMNVGRPGSPGHKQLLDLLRERGSTNS